MRFRRCLRLLLKRRHRGGAWRGWFCARETGCVRRVACGPDKCSSRNVTSSTQHRLDAPESPNRPTEITDRSRAVTGDEIATIRADARPTPPGWPRPSRWHPSSASPFGFTSGSQSICFTDSARVAYRLMCKSIGTRKLRGGHGKRLIIEIDLAPLGGQTMTTKKRSTKLSAAEAVAGDRDPIKALGNHHY